MNIIYIEHEASGRIVSCGYTCIDTVAAIQPTIPGNTVREVSERCQPGRTYWDGAVKPLPVQPSPNHIFDYTAKQWIDPRTNDTQWPIVRRERDKRLADCDWTQLPDVARITAEMWASYRQALRDITTQADPFNISWPVQP